MAHFFFKKKLYLHSVHVMFFKMGQSRPLFVYFSLFPIIQFNKLLKA